VVGALVLFGLLGAIAALFIGTKLEEDNQFCGSCHTEPEVTYLSRFASALATSNADDLASYHHRQLYPRNSPSADYIRCIDCHVGEGILGRGIVLSLAAWDAVKYYSGTAHQPAQVVFTIQNEACLKCHEQEAKKNLEQPKQPFIIDNHYHYKLFEPGAPFEHCVDCHISHREGVEANQFQFRNAIIPVCEDCHRQEGKGPVKM
jgi:hypothetical protein